MGVERYPVMCTRRNTVVRTRMPHVPCKKTHIGNTSAMFHHTALLSGSSSAADTPLHPAGQQDERGVLHLRKGRQWSYPAGTSSANRHA